MSEPHTKVLATLDTKPEGVLQEIKNWYIQPVTLFRPKAVVEAGSSENLESLEGSESLKKKEDALFSIEDETGPCILYFNKSRHDEIQKFDLDKNVLTLYFTKQKINSEDNVYEDESFITPFFDQFPFCHEMTNPDANQIRFNSYSARVAKIYPSALRKGAFDAFCEVLVKNYGLPKDVIDHLQKNLKFREVRKEEEEFYSKDLVEADLGKKENIKENVEVLRAKATLLDTFNKEHYSYQPFKSSGDEKQYYFCDARYSLAKRLQAAVNKNISGSHAYGIFYTIKKESLYYRLAQFNMGRLILDGTMTTDRPSSNLKYHARAMLHLLRSTEAGFQEAITKLTLHDITHQELDSYIHKVMSFKNGDPKHRLYSRVRESIEKLLGGKDLAEKKIEGDKKQLKNDKKKDGDKKHPTGNIDSGNINYSLISNGSIGSLDIQPENRENVPPISASGFAPAQTPPAISPRYLAHRKTASGTVFSVASLTATATTSTVAAAPVTPTFLKLLTPPAATTAVAATAPVAASGPANT